MIRKSELRIERLSKAIPQLKSRIRDITDREYAQSWHTEADKIEAERDALAQELTALYPAFVKKLIDLYAMIDKCDANISKLHSAAPNGECRRLSSVELKARGLGSFSASQPPLRENLKLPDPACPRDICFPPRPENIAYLSMQPALVAMTQKFAFTHGPCWHEAQQMQHQREEEEAACREAEIDRAQLEKKRQYEQALLKADRRGRLGNGGNN